MLTQGVRSPKNDKESEIAAAHRAARSWVDRWLWPALWVVCLILTATALLPFSSVDWWWVRLGDFPRLQLLFAYVAGLATVIPFWRKLSAKLCIAAYIGCVGIQTYWIFPYLPIASHEVEWAQSRDPQSRLRIVSANVLQSNRDPSRLLDLIAKERPDVVVLVEVNGRWMEDLAPLKEQFRFQLTHPLENKYGIAFYTNLQVVSAEVRGMVKAEIPSIDARIRLRNGHVVRVFAVHPNPPRPGEDTTKRDAELILVGRAVKDDDSAIVLGDMNDVGWSRTTDLFKEVSRLLDPRIGRGLYATFDATSWFWRYPLDYLFQSDDFRVAEIRRLPDIGSDHFPLLVELSHEPSAAATQEAPELDQDDREDARQAVKAAAQATDGSAK